MDEHEDGRRVRRTYDEAFKREAVRLVAEEGYTFKAAAQSLGMSEQSLRTWHAKLVPAPPPCGENASLTELKERINASVRQVHADSHGVYGSGKVAKKLAQEEGLERACRNTVARAMREMGLRSRV